MSATAQTIKVEFDPTQPVGARLMGSDEDGPVYLEMTLQDAVIERAAEMLVKRVDGEAVADLKRSISERLHQQLDVAMVPRMAALLDEEITVTESWGSIRFKGTLRDLVIAYAKEQLTEASDRYGHAKTTLSTVIRDEVHGVLAKELTASVREAKKEVTRQLKETAAALIAKTITEGLR